MEKDLCKLTGKRGRFVEAHLIPKSLTKAAEKGSPFIQTEDGRRPIRRWSSWYDKHLVIREGEDILSSLDNWAIPKLRKHKLVWSGWRPNQVLSNVSMLAGIYASAPPNSKWGYRVIKGVNPRRLRLFFLSLLWRAAATDRAEFSQVIMPPDELEKLRIMLVNSNPEPLSFYPVELCQFSTAGILYKNAPIMMMKTIERDKNRQDIPIFRFYFDGLMTHMHRRASDNGLTEWFGSSIVGAGDTLVVATVPFERSTQHEGLKRAIAGSLP